MKGCPWTALVAKEYREALRSRWLIGFVMAFCMLAVGLSWVGTLGATMGGSSSFGRTTAALVNLVLLIVPLMGLTAGALSIAGERERRTLPLLLVLPIRARTIFWGKMAGLALALATTLALAFAATGLVLVMRGGLRDFVLFLQFLGGTLLLAWVSLGLGLWISARSRRIAQAIGFSLIAWLILVFAGDLGILGTALVMKWSPETLLASAALNPLTLYRIFVIDAMSANLEIIGPAGQCARDFLGTGLRPVFLSGLFVWILMGLGAAYWTYRRDPLRDNG